METRTPGALNHHFPGAAWGAISSWAVGAKCCHSTFLGSQTPAGQHTLSVTHDATPAARGGWVLAALLVTRRPVCGNRKRRRTPSTSKSLPAEVGAATAVYGIRATTVSVAFSSVGDDGRTPSAGGAATAPPRPRNTHGITRTRPSPVMVPLRAEPPATMRPSGCTSTSLALSMAPKKSTCTRPLVPNVASSTPVAR